MIFEKSAGAIIFREKDASVKRLASSREYLILAYPRIEKPKEIIWGFPKGQVAEGEPELETARREIVEETGLSEFSFIEGFKEREKYLFKREGEFVSKVVVYFLAQATSNDVEISFEHNTFEWLPLEGALKRLSFKNAREILKKAEEFLAGGERSGQGILL